jgi:uncharacterized OsmC-like protein
MSTLRDYLVHLRDTVRAHRQATKDAPLVPRTVGAKVTAMGGAGARKIQIRDFALISDAKPEAGGFDLGPTPVELLMGSLGACISSSFLHQAAMRQIPVDELVVDVTAQTDPRGSLTAYPDIPNHPHNIGFTVRVSSPATDDELQKLLDGAEQHCSVSNLIRAQETVTGGFERM